jgi:F-type H+-transporting ATPase subunit delta
MQSRKQTKREARQLLRLCHTDGQFDPSRAQRFLQRIFQDRPRGCLPVLVQFERLLKLEYAQHTARVETATPLSSEESAGVLARLERAYGPGLSVSFARNLALIGGMRITVGSDVYDGSVQARLAALEERFS